MRKITGQIEIARPIEVVFDYVADETNEPRYNSDMVHCRKVTRGPIGIGTRYEAVMKNTGPTPMTVELTGYERPLRLESAADIPGTMNIRGAMTFRPTAGGTLMSWEWEVEPHGCMKLLGPFITHMGERNEERIWRSLKTLLEEEPAPNGILSEAASHV